MKLHSTIHDCLYVNWALDPSTAPQLADGMRYDQRSIGGEEYCFASLLLFRQRGLHWVSMPWLPLSHEQANLRLYVVDSDGLPAVVFVGIWVPRWVSGLMRSFGRIPSRGARLDFPRGPVLPEARPTWTVDCGERLTVSIQPGAVAGQRFGSWNQTVDFYRRREIGYVATGFGLRRVDAVQPEAEATPVAATIQDDALADRTLGGVLQSAQLQSAFLCEELPFEFELSSAASEVPQAG